MRFKAVDLKKARRIIRDIDVSRWEMGDLLIKVFPREEWPAGGHGLHTRRNLVTGRLVRGFGIEDAIGEFVAEIDCPFAAHTLRVWRHTALAWPADKRVRGCSFQAHAVLNARPERFDILKPGMTVNEAALSAGIKQMGEKKYDGLPPYAAAVQQLQGAASLKRSAARRLNKLSLTSFQIREIEILIGADADALDLVIDATGIEVEAA